MSQSVPLVIVNPRSGGGRGASSGDVVRRALEERLGPVDVVLTERSGHGIDLARQGATDGRALIIAVGGDGTLHEVANGVLDAGGAPSIGFVGQGTGGDFRRTLGVEHRLEAYIEAIAGRRERTIDVGKVRYRGPGGGIETRWFVNIVSAGLGGLVDHYVADITKALGGSAAYLLASLRALAAIKRGRVRCDVQLGGTAGQRRVETLMIAVCNGRYFGSGMQVAPMARPDDGRFEVVSLNAPSKLRFLSFSRRIYRGTHLSSAGVEHFGCDRIAIDLENEDARDLFLLDVDGEPLGGVPVEIELVPGALRVRG